MTESTRAPAGYRMYDDHTLQRLALISRALPSRVRSPSRCRGCGPQGRSPFTSADESVRDQPASEALRVLPGSPANVVPAIQVRLGG